MDAQVEKMFDNAYLATSTGHVDRCNSHAVAVTGNAVMMNATLINAANLDANDNLVLQLEGSYEGQVWLTTGLDAASSKIMFSSTDVDNASNSTRIDDVDYALLRVRATLVDTDAAGDMKALFSVDLVFTSQ